MSLAGYNLIETHAAAQVYVSQADTRARKAVCFSGRQWARNSQGLYVPKASTLMGTAKEARIISAAGNFQEVRAGGFAIWDEGFNTRLAGLQVTIQSRTSGTPWAALTLPYSSFVELSDPNKPAEWGGYQWTYVAPEGTLVCTYDQLLGSGKWTYQFTAHNSSLTRYRLILTLGLIATPTYTMDSSIDIPSGNQSYTTQLMGRLYRFGSESLFFGWDDMYYAGQFEHVDVDATGARAFSLPFDMVDGQSVTIDPSFTQNAGWNGYVKDSYPTTGTNNTFQIDAGNGNQVFAGRFFTDYVAYKNFRTASRFDISAASGASAITSVTYEPYVLGAMNTYGPGNTTGCYNGTGQGDPSADTTTAWARMDLLANSGWRYVTSHANYKSTGRASFLLGSQANSDVLAALGGGFFTTVDVQASETGSNNYSANLAAYNNTTTANRPDIVIAYTAGAGTQALTGSYIKTDERAYAGTTAPQPLGLAGAFAKTDEKSNAGALAALFAMAGAYAATDEKLNPGAVAAGVVALAGLFAFTDEISRSGTVAPVTSLLGSYITPDEKAFAGTVGAGTVALAGSFTRPDESAFPGTLAAIFALAGAYALTDEQARAGALATFTALSGSFSPTDEKAFLASIAVGAVALAGFSVVTDEKSGAGLVSLGGQALAGAYVGTDERANAGAMGLGAFSLSGVFCATDEQTYAASLAMLRTLQGLGILTDERVSAGVVALNGANLSGVFSSTDERTSTGALVPATIPIQGAASLTDERSYPGAASLGGQILSGSFSPTDEAVRAGVSGIGSSPVTGAFTSSDEKINANTATPATIALLGASIRSDERTLSGILTAAYALSGAPIGTDESVRTAIVTVGLVTVVGVYSKTDELVFQSVIVQGQLIIKTLRARGAYQNTVRKVGAYG